MTAQAPARPQTPGNGWTDPARQVWRLLTNVKFALWLVGTATAVSMVGVVVPQMPVEMQGNPAAQSAWLELQREDFGPLTDTFDRLEIFDIFHSAWFVAMWGLIIVAVTVCTVSRLRPTARSVHRPQKQVGDRYFETAKHHAAFRHEGGEAAVTAVLRKKRYSVERTHEADGSVYLFAERFSWAQYGTFISHLALLMLLIGGLLTVTVGFQRTLAIAEGTSAAPVFRTPGADQIFIEMVDAHEGQDGDGNIVDFHSDLAIRRGDEVVTCTTTVNGPCSAFGYRFHQAAFFDDLARLRIVGPDGRMLWDDVVDFNDTRTGVPFFQVTNAAGVVLFEQELPQMASAPGVGAGAEELAVSELGVPLGDGTVEVYTVTWRTVGGRLAVTIAGAALAATEMSVGSVVESDGLRIEYVSAVAIPGIEIADMPGAVGGGLVGLQLPEGGNGEPYLFMSGVDEANVVLQLDQPVTTTSGYTYEFTNRVDASGIDVRRDPGDTFIWVAVGLAIIGLAITFYVPRRRLWVRVTGDRTQMAGVAERTTRYARELRFMGAALGAEDALTAEDLERD